MPSVSESMMQAAMVQILGLDGVLAGNATRRAYDSDAYGVERFAPTVVVLPTSTLQVQEIVRWCNANDVPFTPRGAGTGLSGGAMPAMGGIIISTKRLNQILEIDLPNRRLHAQSGVVNAHLSKAVNDHGLHFAPDPSSQTVATLGGNIAENSGGPHTLKYGVTAQHVLGLTMVSPNGEIWVIEPNASGGPGPDWMSLIVGSEGTLGVVTEAWVKLTSMPKFVQTVLISFGSVREATQCVADIIATGTIPAALEMMDRAILVAVRDAFGLELLDETKAMLLIECDGGDEDQVSVEINQVVKCAHALGALKIEVANLPEERKKLWTARKKGIGAMGRLAPSIVTHDGVIPRSKLPEMLDFVYAVAAEFGVGVANMFHAGDGNLHPCFYFDDRDKAQIDAVVAAGEKIMRKCVELGGSLTGEHGIGVEKVGMMGLMFSAQDLAYQGLVKEIFNSNPLCNPCKMLPDQKGCVEHMSRWRGAAT
jgi:glycolate oxidase